MSAPPGPAPAADRGTPVRPHRVRRWFVAALAFGLTGWIGAFLGFAGSLPSAPAEPGRAVDAIVVLTGGAERVETGLRLLAAGQARLLLISGVHAEVTLADLAPRARLDPAALSDRVTLGHAALTTRGNAAETAAWARANGVRSVRLVTSSYHMPRALIEFGRSLPEIEILPHPVLPPGFEAAGWWRRASVLMTEFGKYLLAALGLAGDGLDPQAPAVVAPGMPARPG
ncbi:MAG: YdcF family protein [Alphaproteobacteria bacterium]|nr:YdcF family protein [Alphaproteobacteria bacterium]